MEKWTTSFVQRCFALWGDVVGGGVTVQFVEAVVMIVVVVVVVAVAVMGSYPDTNNTKLVCIYRKLVPTNILLLVSAKGVRPGKGVMKGGDAKGGVFCVYLHLLAFSALIVFFPPLCIHTVWNEHGEA